MVWATHSVALENPMKKLIICAALVVSAVPVQAQNSFSIDINGRTVRVAIPKRCADDHCLSITTAPADAKDDTTGQRIDGARLGGILSDLLANRRRPVDEDATEAAPLPPAPKAASAGSPPIPGPTPSVPAAPASAAPPPAPTNPNRPELALAQPEPAAAPPASRANPETSPAGIWLTQNKEGRVHIVPCGDLYCGYVFDKTANKDGAKVLIDMKPLNGTQWVGRVHDPKGGGTYDATMALKSPDSLAIRGCAMGGLICRGQTWSRG